MDENVLGKFLVRNSGRDNPQQFSISEDRTLLRYTGKNPRVFIPAGVRRISFYAFQRSTAIREILIPDSVEEIEGCAFIWCQRLDTIVFGRGISELPDGLCRNLSNLCTIILPAELKAISETSFRNCRKLENIYTAATVHRSPESPLEKGMSFEALVRGEPYLIEDCAVSRGNTVYDALMQTVQTENSPVTAVVSHISDKKKETDGTRPSTAEQESIVLPKVRDDTQAPSAAHSPINSKPALEMPKEEKGIIEPVPENGTAPENETPKMTSAQQSDFPEEATMFPGIYLKNGEILDHTTGCSAPDHALDSSDISRESQMVFRKAGSLYSDELMLSDILKLRKAQIDDLEPVGTWYKNHALDELQNYLIHLLNHRFSTVSKAHDNEEPSLRETLPQNGNPEENVRRSLIDDQASRAITGIQTDPEQSPLVLKDYRFTDGYFEHTKTGEKYCDTTLDALGLSVRSYNALKAELKKRGQKDRLSSFANMTLDQLQHIKNIGNKSSEDICHCIQAYFASENAQVRAADSGGTNQVLASGYTVKEGMICSKTGPRIVPDAPLAVLNLSFRTVRFLSRANIFVISQLVEKPVSELMKINGMESSLVEETGRCLNRYLADFDDQAAAEAVHQVQLDKIRKEVKEYLRANQFDPIPVSSIQALFPDTEEEVLNQILEPLCTAGKILLVDSRITVPHQSFYDWIQKKDFDNNRTKEVILLRAGGCTLAEAGDTFGLTRERIRQIEVKFFKNLSQKHHEKFSEDLYAELYKNYAAEKEFFETTFHTEEREWYYLSTRYNSGNKNMAEAVSDKSIPASVRKAVYNWEHRQYIQVHGVYIQKTRTALANYIMEKFCRNTVSFDKFCGMYTDFLQEHKIEDKKLELTESAKRSLANMLSDSMKALWKHNQRMRYYDIEQGDYSALLTALDLGKYHNTEISTLKFINDFPELMSEYDIQDEYELHNLLKKIHAETENPELVFSRMPNLQFGQFDKRKAMIELLQRISPVTTEEFLQQLQEEYGAKPETIMSNWLPLIADFYSKGKYSVNNTELSQVQIEILRKELTEDFYYMEDVKRIYHRCIPDGDESLLSVYNLKKMGFIVGSTYIVQHFDSAEAYFRSLLLTQDVTDISGYKRKFAGLSSFSCQLSELRANREIIEFEPDQYINIRRLQQLGYDRRLLEQYCDEVIAFAENRPFFTVRSLKQAGFTSKLDSLGFSDLFYASLIKQDPRISWQRICLQNVFSTQVKNFSRRDFLGALVQQNGSIYMDSFLDMLLKIYGIDMERDLAVYLIQDADCYYDKVMDKLYPDYDTYFKEI